MVQIMEEYGILLKDIREIWPLAVYANLWKL